MLLTRAGGTRVVEVHQAVFDGTILTRRVAHGAPPNG
jgi:hypothetical protein